MLMMEKLQTMIGQKVTIILPPNQDGQTNTSGTLKQVGEDCIVLTNWVPGVKNKDVPECVIPMSAISLIFETTGI